MKALILSTWFDGGPDEWCTSYKILDENFNELPLPTNLPYWEEIELLNEDSHDEEIEITLPWLRWLYRDNDERVNLVSKEIVESVAAFNNAYDEWEAFTDKMSMLLPEDWNNCYSEDYCKEESEKAHSLWKKAHELEAVSDDEYKNAPLAVYNLHVIGVTEFCQRFGIDKVIRLQ